VRHCCPRLSCGRTAIRLMIGETAADASYPAGGNSPLLLSSSPRKNPWSLEVIRPLLLSPVVGQPSVVVVANGSGVAALCSSCLQVCCDAAIYCRQQERRGQRNYGEASSRTCWAAAGRTATSAPDSLRSLKSRWGGWLVNVRRLYTGCGGGAVPAVGNGFLRYPGRDQAWVEGM
jgi:hypothetical protein